MHVDGRVLALSLGCVSPAVPAAADAVLDGSTGLTSTFAGNFEIPAAVGRRAGGNLFHSFERFSILRGESATFTGPPDGIENVISRVTGDQPSMIDGRLASTIPDADFFFLNRNGVVFGPGAELAVDGAFHVSTADQLRFANGARLSATNADTGSFTSAAPEAFGFLGGSPAEIVVRDSILAVNEGEAVSLVAGGVGLHGGTLAATSVLAAAQHARGDVPLGRAGPPLARDGRITLGPGDSGRSQILSTGPRGGTIRIEGGEVILDRSVARDLNRGDFDSDGGIEVAAQTLSVVGHTFIDQMPVGLLTFAGGRGRAGGITVLAPEVRVRGGMIGSLPQLQGPGPAGDVSLRAQRMELANQSQISAPGSAAASDARGGTITVTADEALTVRDQSLISTGTLGEGDGGELIIDAGRLEIAAGGSVSAATLAGSGRGGRLDIEADAILVDNGVISAGASEVSAGPGGEIDVTAENIIVRNAGSIEAATLGAEAGGGITVHASDAIEITSDAVVTTLTGSTGPGGSITLKTPRLRLDDGRINASTRGSGRAGSIRVRAGQADIIGGARIFSDAASGIGDAGEVSVVAKNLRISGGSRISSDTFDGGNAGEVTVRAGRLSIDGAGAQSFTGISSDANRNSIGAAGTVTVAAGRLEVTEGAQIGSSGLGLGRAGDVSLVVSTLSLSDAQIQTVGRTAEGGRITATASELISLVGAAVTSDGVEPSPGDSIIRLEAPAIVLNSSEVTSLTGGEPIVGSGEARLLGELTVISPDSRVAAASTLEVTGLESDLTAGIDVLPSVFLDASSLLREGCEARSAGSVNSFVQTGRGGVSAEPDALLPGSYAGLAVTTPARAEDSSGALAGAAPSDCHR